MKQYKKVSSEVRLHTPRLEAVAVTYQADDGDTIKHTIIESKPSVAVIVIDDDNRVAFLRQFRTTTGQYYMELPAGLIEAGESKLMAAYRETEEEMGILIQEAYSMTDCPNLLDPSKSNEDFGVVAAKFADFTKRHLDEGERIEKEILWIPMEEVRNNLKASMLTGEYFDKEENLHLSGHSMYALLTYFFLKD